MTTPLVVYGDAFSAEIDMKHVCLTAPALAERSVVPLADAYRIIKPIRILRKEMKLTSNDLVTLQALISFLPREHHRTCSELTVVFPSNAALSERTNGLDERTLRRCLSRLVSAGLIARRDSATRKRFPLRYDGVIRDAFGFDLAPMYQRETELSARAQEVIADIERLRSMRAKALALRNQALNRCSDEAILSFLADARNILRRATVTIDVVSKLIQQMAKIIDPECEPVENSDPNNDENGTAPDQMSGGTGQIDRLVEHNKIEKYKASTEEPALKMKSQKHRNPRDLEWSDLDHLSQLFPDEPRRYEEVIGMLNGIGRMLRIAQDQLRQYLLKFGPGKLLIALDEMLGRFDTIRHPSRYLAHMLAPTR